ncbi:MAG: Iron-sulfur cluster repair protein YtfE [Myxococcota bacterium]|nr:Iron-sulfur cluster repair protein YtfE [Myxococcota bacterium]
MINPLSTLGDIAATGPETRGVLLRYQLDFCCGGRRSLADSCERAGVRLEQVIADLESASQRRPSPEDWQNRPLEEVIQHIMKRYHNPLPQQLEGLIAAAGKVERVHGEKSACPVGLTAHIRNIQGELMNHMAKEEHVLFPAILSGKRGEMLGGPVMVMMREHDAHGENLRRTRTLTRDFVPPPEACATWRTLYDELARLEKELMEHIHLENNILFPRALREN